MQEEQSRINKIALNTKAYEAWLRLHGTPTEIAQAMVNNPKSFRRWTMGEIVSSIADSGLVIRKLIEEPSKKNSHFPSSYTIVSNKLLNLMKK